MTDARVRPPAVAGTFYPGSPAELEATVDGLLARARAALPPDVARPKVLIVPHAGYVYSGPIAATAFARVPAGIERVVLLGPAHRVAVDGLAWPGATRLRTPLGELEVDVDTLARLPVVESVAAHAREHSLEVELPFLQRVAPGARIVPLVASRATPEQVGAVLDAAWGGPETLIVLSSDLSHFLAYDEARARDRRTVERILALEPTLGGHDACGCTGLNGLLWLARRRGLRLELLDLRTSGDTAGTRDEVVGYAAIAGYEGAGA